MACVRIAGYGHNAEDEPMENPEPTLCLAFEREKGATTVRERGEYTSIYSLGPPEMASRPKTCVLFNARCKREGTDLGSKCPSEPGINR